MATKYDTIIRNGTVVTASDVRSVRVHSPCHSASLTLLLGSVCDIGIKDGKIAALATSFSEEDIASAKVIDAEYVPHARPAPKHSTELAPTEEHM